METPSEAVAPSTPLNVDIGASASTIPSTGTNIDSTTPRSPPPPPSSQSTSVLVQQIIDRVLHFLAHASNETLGACLVGLGATTYLVLGRLGLVIIGVAAGIILQATWEGTRGDSRDEETIKQERARRNEIGVDLLRRVLELKESASRDEIAVQHSRVYGDEQLDFSSFSPATATALDRFTTAVITDYVYYWYGPTVPGEDSFPGMCKRTLTAFILSITGHLQRKRPADVFLDFTTNASSIIIVFLNELAAATNASPSTSAEDAITSYIMSKPDSGLAYLLDEKSQSRKLSAVAEDVLQAYLDPKSYNCPPIHLFLKEILAQLVLGYSITLCSRPEWINEWIVYGLEESETASKVMDIVDAGVEGRATVPGEPSLQNTPPPRGDILSKKEGNKLSMEAHGTEHRRHMSRAEEAMDEAMREAKRLTQLMIEEDERRARETATQPITRGSSEDTSDVQTTHGIPTPTSSQSDRDQPDEEVEVLRTAQASDANSLTESDSANVSPPALSTSQFTSFDQIVPPTGQLDAWSPIVSDRNQLPLTLHQAKISIFDDSQPGERASIKAKPITEYLIQIEPNNFAYTGWMISRKYADFEILHEVLRRISVITGVVGFAEQHANMPQWKGNSKASLRSDLEKYLVDAVRYQPLAESEGMKRFLEKDKGLSKSPSGKGFGWPAPDAFGKLGGDMMNVLTKAPKQVAGGVAGGGKAVFGGVAGLVTSGRRSTQMVGQNKGSPANEMSETDSPGSQQPTNDVYPSSPIAARASQDSFSPAHSIRPAFNRQLSTDTTTSVESRARVTSSRPSNDFDRSIVSLNDSTPALAIAPSLPPTEEEPLSRPGKEILNLPPPPSEMPADYMSPKKSIQNSGEKQVASLTEAEQERPMTPSRSTKPATKPKAPLTERETIVAVELIFAVVSELYTLSSAWTFRRTLLTAAKTFLLRPGNPQLVAIRDLLQGSLIDANLSDDGLASHVLKLRENALPTAEELEAWTRDYPEKTAEEKEVLRIKARKLLVTKGMPQALSSVMGAAASGEALGKVFDCLQVESISRGLVFGLMLQALRMVIE